MWHLMKYYAHFGHTEFIVCLGYKADVIKQYFLAYNECLSNNFVMAQGGKHVELLKSDIQDWRITFVDTGISRRHRGAASSRAPVRRGRRDVPGELHRLPYRPGSERVHGARSARQRKTAGHGHRAAQRELPLRDVQ